MYLKMSFKDYHFRQVKMWSFELRLCSVRRRLMLANVSSASAGEDVKDLWWIIQSLERTIHTRRGGSGGAGYLPGKTGALDGLGALLDFVLVAAAVQRHHLTSAGPNRVRCRRTDMERKDRWGISICIHIPKEPPQSSPRPFIQDSDIVEQWKVDNRFPWKSVFILWVLNWSFCIKLHETKWIEADWRRIPII